MLEQFSKEMIKKNLVFKGFESNSYPCPVFLKKKAVSFQNAVIEENVVLSLFGTLLDIEDKVSEYSFFMIKVIVC